MRVSAAFTQEKVSGGNNTKSNMEKTVLKMVSLQEEINRDIDRLVNLKKDIKEAINHVSDLNYQLLLDMRYISGKGWDDVSASLGCDPRTDYRIHSKALKEFEKNFKYVSKCQWVPLYASRKYSKI